jgi:hypothetical protein
VSTYTAVGPALAIDGPLPVTPSYGLLDIPGVRKDGGRELNGVVVYGFPEEVPEGWEPCAAGTYRVKDEGSGVSTPRFDPVGLYVPITCSALSVNNNGNTWRDFAGRAEKVLEATLSYGVTQVLSQGVVGSANPFLGDAGVTKLNAGAATAAQNALSFLENAIGATGRKGIIHADNATAAAWSVYLEAEGDTLYTIANGTPVSVSGGYQGGLANGSAPGAGNSWAYASGPVQVFVGEPTLVGEDINGTLDTSNNDVTFRAERFVLAEWDTALQAAVLVDWTP